MINTNEKQKVVIYSKATKEEAQSSYSLKLQRKALRDYAEKNNLEIIREFSDVGSCIKTNRKGFNDMLKFLKDSKEDCKTILVTKADGLCKDFETFSKLQNEYSVISVECGANDMMNLVQMIFAWNYSRNLSERIKAGIQKRKAREQEKKVLVEKEGVEK